MPTLYDVQGHPVQVPAKVTGAELRKTLQIPPTKDIYLIKDESDSYTRVPEYHPIPVKDQARIEVLSSFASG
ncbi:MAG TPA: hypothetical protein VNM22_17950 [Candidatus Limnocylindrales bacterium]|nr:hypothetical protein [Candidatus Limnocylindrales bacterium]